MPHFPIYQVDAFTDRVFGGNPAAVIPLAAFPDDEWLLNVAVENNLSETAYFVPRADGYDLRWFTPGGEVDLCGHATLATAHVLFAHFAYHLPRIDFRTRSGLLSVTRAGTDGYCMDFPTDRPVSTAAPAVLAEMGLPGTETLRGKDDYLVVLEKEQGVRDFQPDDRLILQLDARGLIITAPGEQCDFVSRCFYPAYGISEDPVTGSAHTVSAPYWAGRLGRRSLSARQLSKRGGRVDCELHGERIVLTGSARTYLEGHIFIP